jgi:DNA-3-methyladenine glycosylase II
MDIGGERHYAFPCPERLARARETTLRNMQFSGRKPQYVIGVARAAADGLLDADELRRLPLEKAIARQVSIRGVGR